MTYEQSMLHATPLATMADDAGARRDDAGHSHEAGEPQPAAAGPMKVLIVDRRGALAADIRSAGLGLEDPPAVIVVDHPTGLVERILEESPDVVLAGPEEITTAGLHRLAQIHRALPKTVIALTQGSTPIAMTDAASCGATAVITYPATPAKLRNGLERILQAAAAAAAVPAERVVVREVIRMAPAPAAPAAQPVPATTAKIFTVTSPTGGCGKTFFATNLAAYLAGVTGGRVLLIDLDLQFGEVSLALGMRPQRTIADLVNEDSLEEAFGEYVVDHSSGYKVLSAPADPFAAELVGPREATRVLEAARGLFDYIVVDTPPSLNEVVLAAFDQSRYLVVMATMDVPSLRNLRVFLETIDRLMLPAEDVSCVLNKAEPDNGIDLAELLRVYPGGFAAVLPYAKEVSRSLNVGKPVLITHPRSEISQKLLECGAKLIPASDVHNAGWLAKPAARPAWSGHRGHRHHPAPAGSASLAGMQQAALGGQGFAAATPTPAPLPALIQQLQNTTIQGPALPVQPPLGTSQQAPIQTDPQTSGQRQGWFARLFGRRQRHPSAPGLAAAPATTARPVPATMGALSRPLGHQGGIPAHDAGPSLPQKLVFAGSRAAVPAPPLGRAYPNRQPSASWKEPRR